MIIPVRCMSCGKPIGQVWDQYIELCKTKSGEKALDEVGLVRYCCRAQVLGHVDLIDVAAKFKKF